MSVSGPSANFPVSLVPAQDGTEQPHDGASHAGPIDREHLLDRLTQLRGILPVFAEELASARRQATELRADNRILVEAICHLLGHLAEHKPTAISQSVAFAGAVQQPHSGESLTPNG